MTRKIIFLINVVTVLVTLSAYSLFYIPLEYQNIFLGGTLLIPPLLFFNFIFFIYWGIRLEKKVFLSSLTLILGVNFIPPFFSINFKNKINSNNKVIKVGSFNVFNYKKQNLHSNKSNDNCFAYFDELDVNFFGVQEDHLAKKNENYSYDNIQESYTQSWIYSKNKIIRSEILEEVAYWENRKDYTFSDIIVKNDTLRVYNFHGHSYVLSKDPKKIQKRGIKSIVKRIQYVFLIHKKSTDVLIEHINASPYPVIVIGDFNNNAYSYEYRQLIEQCNLKDTFVEAGSGFGATYDFKYFPTRIDFILVPKTAMVHSHKVIRGKGWSDHFPIVAEISFK